MINSAVASLVNYKLNKGNKMSEITKVKYEVDFNNIPQAQQFFDELKVADIITDELPETTPTVVGAPALSANLCLVNNKTSSRIEFTLPRLTIKRFEKFRKRFMIKNCTYSDKISTVSEYLF